MYKFGRFRRGYNIKTNDIIEKKEEEKPIESPTKFTRKRFFNNLYKNKFYQQYLYTITSQNNQGFDFVGSQWQKYANKNFDSAINNFSLTDTILNLPNSIVDFIVDMII